MNRRKRIVLSSVLLLAVLLLAACPSTTTAQRQQAASAALVASTAIASFQQVEINAYQHGLIPAEDHRFIQTALLAVGRSGETMDACIETTTDAPGIVSCINLSIATVDQLNSDGVLGLKSEEAKTDFSLAMIGARTSLASIAAVFGGTK